MGIPINTSDVDIEADNGVLIASGKKIRASSAITISDAGIVTISGVGFTTGMIILWSGTIATIPSGWVLCNGSNGTPDLRDKFIVGAKQDDSGIAKTNVSGSLTISGGNVSHTHTDSGHTHSATFTGTSQLDGGITLIDSLGTGNYDFISTSVTTSGTTNFGTAALSTTNHLNPYYALAYIMKT